MLGSKWLKHQAFGDWEVLEHHQIVQAHKDKHNAEEGQGLLQCSLDFSC